MPENIYSSYAKAKRVLKAISNRWTEPNRDAEKIITEFFLQDPFFRIFCNNILSLSDNQRNLLNNIKNFSQQRLKFLHDGILLFIYNAAGEGVLDNLPSIPPDLDQLVKELENNNVISQSDSLKQAAQKIEAIPSLKKQIKNAENTQALRIQAEQKAYQQLVENLQTKILATTDQKAVEGIKKLSQAATPEDIEKITKNASAAAEEATRDIIASVAGHIRGGGGPTDPFLKKAIVQKLKQNPVNTILFNNKKIEQVIESFIDSQDLGRVSAAHRTQKLDAPTPTDIVKSLENLSEINQNQAIEIFAQVEKTLFLQKNISVRQALSETISSRIPGLSQEKILQITNKLLPQIHSYKQATVKLLPIEKISRTAAERISEFCISFNKNYHNVTGFFLGFRDALEFTSGLTDASHIGTNEQFSGQPLSRNLTHKIKVIEEITSERIRVLENQGFSLPSLKKLPTPNFLRKPISVVENFGGIFRRIPKLKRFGNFLKKLAPSAIKKRVGMALLKYGVKNITKTGLKGLLGKLTLKLGASLLGKAAVALAGGPVGAAIAIASTTIDLAMLAKTIKDLAPAAKKFFKEKILPLLTGGLLFIGGLLGGLLSALGGIALAGLGIGMIAAPFLIPALAPLAPILIPLGAGLTFAGAWKSLIKPWLAKTGSALQAGIQPFLHSLSTGWGGATIPSYITLSPAIAVAGTAAVTFISYMTLISAFAIPPSGAEVGMPFIAGNRVTNPNYDHPAIHIANAIGQFSNGVLNQNNWNPNIERELQKVAPEGFEEIRHSVWGIAGNSNLQCVGFKIAVEKELGIDLPRQNAVAFLYNHPDCDVKTGNEAQSGDNAVWGPDSKKCPTANYEEANKLCASNIYCCGHIGIVTGTSGNVKLLVTSAHGESGEVYTEETTRDNPTKFLRCEK